MLLLYFINYYRLMKAFGGTRRH